MLRDRRCIRSRTLSPRPSTATRAADHVIVYVRQSTQLCFKIATSIACSTEEHTYLAQPLSGRPVVAVARRAYFDRSFCLSEQLFPQCTTVCGWKMLLLGSGETFRPQAQIDLMQIAQTIQSEPLPIWCNAPTRMMRELLQMPTKGVCHLYIHLSLGNDRK